MSMTAPSGRLSAMLARLPVWVIATGVLLIALQVAVLHGLGQPLVAASGHIQLWVGDPLSPDTSQQLTDWYSFSHFIHGVIFFWLLRRIAPRLPFGVRLLIAMAIEIAWEFVENSPPVILHYRQQALAAGYRGDSILNSVSDTVMMSAGFFVASILRLRTVIVLALGLEIFTALSIRDNLTLNVFNLIAPAGWAPVQAIHRWQAGTKRPGEN